MICCSASIEVERPSESPPHSPALEDGGAAGRTCARETYEEEGANQTDKREHPCKEEENVSTGVPTTLDSSPPKSSHLVSPHILANHDISASSFENPPDVKGIPHTAEVYDPNNTEDNFLNSSSAPEKQDVCGAMRSTVSWLAAGGPGLDGLNEEDFTSSLQNSRAQKYFSFSLPLSEAAAGVYPGDSALATKQQGPQVPSEDSDSDYELCPEITLTYTEEFSDDDLEYLECSDVMTDYSNAVWQSSLLGTEHVFLLESDDEEMEFSECGLGGCGHFLSEMGCGAQVSGDTGPMDATTGFCGHHSQSQEVGARCSRAFRHSPSSLRPLGPQQDGTATVTRQGPCPPPPVLGAAENDYPGIPGETRDSHQGGEESASDNLLTMDKGATEAEGKPLSGGLDKSGLKQDSGGLAEGRSEGKPSGSRRGVWRPTRVRWPGMRGKAKKLTPEENASEGTFNPTPREPTKHPRGWSHQRETLHATAGVPGRNLHFHAGQCAISPPAQQHRTTLGPPAVSLSMEEDTGFEGRGMWVKNVLETIQVPDPSDHLQVQIQEMGREGSSRSHVPAFPQPAGEASPFRGTTMNSFSTLGEIQKANASLAQYLESESYTQGPEQEDKPDGEGNILGGSRTDLKHELSTPTDSHESVSQAVPSVLLPLDASAHCSEPEALSVASLEPPALSSSLEKVCSGSGSREAAHVTECFDAGDQGTCYDTMDPAVGAPVDKYLPQEICSVDFELTEGQSKVRDLRSPDDKALAGLPQTRGSAPPPSTWQSCKDSSVARAPVFISTLAWNMSQEASQGAASILSSPVQAGWERLGPCDSGGLEETQVFSSENNSFVHFKEGGDKSAGTSVPGAPDMPASHSSVEKFPRKKLTVLSAGVDCLQVTREIEDTSIVAPKARPAKYQAVSISENNRAGGAGEGLPAAPSECHFQFPFEVQPDPIVNGSTAESPKEGLCLAPSVPGSPGHSPLLQDGESFHNCPLQTDNWSKDESQTMDKAIHRSPDEGFPEKGSETEQRMRLESPSRQGSLSAEDFQERVPPTSTSQEEVTVEPLEHSPANSRQGRGHGSGPGTGVSEVVEATVERDNQVLSNAPSLSAILLGESEDTGLGDWEVRNQVRIITLEASVSEIWPTGQGAASECKETEAGLRAHDVAWALADVLKAGDQVPELNTSGTAARAPCPQAETTPAPANNRDTHEGHTPAGDVYQLDPSSLCLNRPRLLESCVDPIEDKEFHVPSSLSEAFLHQSVNNVCQDQDKTQLKGGRPAFLSQLLALPHILESSVDPIDETGEMEPPRVERPQPSESTRGAMREGSTWTDGNLGWMVGVQAARPQGSGETIPKENRINQDQAASEREGEEQSHHTCQVEVQPAIWQVAHPAEGGRRTPSARGLSQIQDGGHRKTAEAEQNKEDKAELIFPMSPLPSCLAVMTRAPVEVETQNSTGQIQDGSANDFVEPRNHQYVLSDSKERGTVEECGIHVPSSSDPTQSPRTSPPKGNVTHFSISRSTEELKMEEPQIGETKPPSSSGSPTMTLAFISGKSESEKAPELVQGLCQRSTLGSGKKSREKEKPSHLAAHTGKLPRARPAVAGSEEVKKIQAISGSGHIAEGVKKKILSRVAALRLRLEEKENVTKNSSLLKKMPKLEKSVSQSDENTDPQKTSREREGKAPVLLRKIQAEMSHDHSGNVKLSCQFAEIHEDSTIWWTKDSKSIAQVQRRYQDFRMMKHANVNVPHYSAGDNSSVSLVIVQAGQKDQGLYYCCIKNSFGKVTAEFNLTAEVLKQLSSHQNNKGCEEIEFSQLIFREDFLRDSYFGDRLRGQIATEQLHFGEGVHRKAFRSTVMQGLMPVFQPGHACVLKVHNAVAYGTRNNDELVQRNYKLAAQECYVQNTARYYAKIYAAEAQPLEGFGEVPEIIPIFLIHRPENNIPYATVEEELIGEFVKYSIRDGKEINFLRRESEAGQKCCTFQHWVYQKTSGCLLVTDMQGVGMKLTDVGIATEAKGYKGFKGNCSMTFIDQFKALHQCNKYCKMLGLKSLQNSNQKPKKPNTGKSKAQTNTTVAKPPERGAPAGKKASRLPSLSN